MAEGEKVGKVHHHDLGTNILCPCVVKKPSVLCAGAIGPDP